MDRQVEGKKGCGRHQVPTEQFPASTWGDLGADVKLPVMTGGICFQENRL